MRVGLFVHVAEDLDALADIAADLLVTRRGPVLDRDCIVVPSAPVRQWLDWRLAERLGTSSPDHSDGVVANVVNYFPDEFVRLVEHAACSVAGHTVTNWNLDTLTVRVLGSQVPRLTVARARELAEEIDDLLRWRPDVVVGETPPARGAEEALRVYRTLGHPDHLPLAQKNLARDVLRRGSVPGLPARTIVFGLASVPGGPTFAELVRDLSTHSDVHVLLASIDAEHVRAALRGHSETTDRRALASWARESEEAIAAWHRVAPNAAQWDVRPSPVRTGTALSDVACSLRTAPLAGRDLDDSIIVVGASGIDRQVEQLRDVLLSTMGRHSVDSRDVLVATTDPTAVMDAIERHWLTAVDERHVPRLPADPTVVAASDARHRLDASVVLLALLRARCTSQEILDVLQYPAVATTLGVDRDGHDRLVALCHDADLTFGVSPRQREPFGIYHEHGGLRTDAGTWQRLVDRVVATSVIGEAGSDSALGVPDDLDLVARLDPLLRVIDDVARERTREGALREWVASLGEWMDVIAGDARVFDDSLSGALDRVGRTLADEDTGPRLTLDEFAELWNLVARGTARQRVFGRSGVTVTDVASLAYAPHRVVCLVGLDDHRLPTGSWPSAVMGERRSGDPDPRFSALAAVRAACATARDTLIVTFTDRRLDDGRSLEPPIALDELLEVVSTVTGTARPDLVRTSPRHAFSVPSEIHRMIDTTLDPRAAGLTTPVLTELPVPSENLQDVDVTSLRSFVAGPVSYYLRRTLRAEIPDEVPDDSTIPPLSLDDSHRATLQREYLWIVAEEIRRRHPRGSLPPMPIGGHGESTDCDAACAWLHEITRPVRASLTGAERHNANVPPRLWRHRMVFAQLDLGAYNLARDLGVGSRWTLDQWPDELGDVALSDGTNLQCASMRAVLDHHVVVAHDDVLAIVSVDPRAGRAKDWRRVLRTALDVVVLRALVPDRTIVAHAYFLPDRTTPYENNNARFHVVAGQLPGNPRTTLRFNGDAERAGATLGAFVDLFRRGCREPIPLFPQTSVAAVATSLRRSAADAWHSFSGFGESQVPAHQLLFPYSARDLLALDGGHLPLRDELAAILGRFSVEDLSQAQRGHDGTGDSHGDDDEPDLFVPLTGAP